MQNENQSESLLKLQSTAWLPSEFIINFIRELIATSRMKKNYLLVERVIQGITHHAGEKTDLCMDCALAQLTISKETNSLLLPYINENNVFPAHYRFIHIELKTKHIILWDPFGEKSQYTDLTEVQKKIKNMPFFNDFSSQILTQKAQYDGYSCGDWIMQCYAWSVEYDFCNKSLEEIDKSHQQHMQHLFSYLEHHKKTVRDLTTAFLANHSPEFLPMPAPDSISTHLSIEQGRDYFYRVMPRSQQMECIKLMIKKGQNYYYLFDAADKNHCQRMQKFIEQEENRTCFIAILRLLDADFSREIACRVNVGFEEPLIPLELLSMSLPQDRKSFLLQKIKHTSTCLDALHHFVDFFKMITEKDIPLCLTTILELTTRFNLTHLALFYHISASLKETFEKEASKNRLFCSILKSAILESLHQTTRFEHFFIRFLGVSETVFIQLNNLCEQFRYQPLQTYLIDCDLPVSIFQLQLFDTVFDDAVIYFLLTQLMTALFDIDRSYLLKKIVAALVFSGCQQLKKDFNHQKKAHQLAECLLKALLLTNKVPRILQQDIFVSLLMIFQTSGFISLLKTMLSVTTEKHFCLNSQAIGNGMLEFCGRTRKTLLQFFETFIMKFSVLQWELLIAAVLQAIAENPFFFKNQLTFSPSLESYLFNISQHKKELYDLIQINFKKDTACLYLRLIIRSLPMVAVPDEFIELPTALIVILDQLLSKSLQPPLLAFNYILLLNKTKNSFDAFRLIHFLKPLNCWMNLFDESLQTLAQSRHFANTAIAHQYCLMIESGRDFIHILYATHRFNEANPLLLQLLNENYYPENNFENYSRKDRRTIIENLNLVFNTFSSEQLSSFIEFLEEKPLGPLLTKILLSYLLKNIQQNNSHRTKRNLLDFLQLYWKTVNPQEEHHENILKTLQHLQIVNVTDHHSHALMANILKYMISELNTTLKATPQATRAIDYQRLLTTFVAFLDENYNNPDMAELFKKHYTSFYTDMRLTNSTIFQNVAHESGIRRNLSGLFFSGRSGLCNAISEPNWKKSPG
ncbi:MAG: hypothetical protein A3F17_03380 [Gammaproteobacteria bacterium RIFCSPHIGHO2_12_FULL_41_15]|nr:MAG: hypothetical protein A3F17_03380 [Gammaproteobacteria bacterium RIFCSPHIGHO2_12_FULL_41_15]